MKSLAKYRFLWAAVTFVMAAALLSACNANKKNTALSRQYTAFITRYNIYYNGDTHYKETLDKMEDKYEDDFTRTLFMHPVEAKNDKKAPQPTGDFTRSIEKAQKAIQVRSIKKKPARKQGKNSPEYKEWLKRDEYNPFLHNAWMMMGNSQYYNGDFLGAAATFFYISKHFTWLPEIVTEAKLMQARSYLALDWLYEAEVIITRIKPEQLTTSQLNALYNFCFADFYIKSKEPEKALPYLKEAVAKAKGAQKTRLCFLLGQTYAQLGQKELAYEAFKKAGSSSSAPYRVKVNARIKQSEVYSGTNIEPEVKALRRMTRYDRNKPYLDQIYYAIGNLYLSRGDTAHAIENYQLSIDKSQRGGIEKAISQITLGQLYFDLRNYEKAQPCYSEAVPLLPDTYPNYALLKKRSDVLDELAVYSQNVNLQDSLLRLAAMPEEQRLAVIDKIIEELKKKEKEEAEAREREEFLAQSEQQQATNGIRDNNQREFSINNDDSWYFYNASTKNAGKSEFQKRWGARKLEDDWRRRNKATFNTSDFDSDSDEEAEEGENPGNVENPDSVAAAKPDADLASDPHNREYYLQQIPSTPEEVANAHEIIQEGLYNMGIILKDKLEDYPAALAEFNRLLKDYPDNIYRLDVYYNLYLMFMRQGKEAEAEKYRQLILSDFADSPYGLALKNPKYLDNLRQMDVRQQELYDKTYAAYLDNRNAEVHQAYETMMEEYPLSKIMPKFMFLDALAYVTEKNPEKFNAVLRDLLDRYPQTDITPIASAWLSGMAKGRDLQSTEANMRGMIWDIRLTNDENFAGNDSIMNFEIDEAAPQLLILTFPTDQVNANELLYETARFNFNSFVVKDFDLELMNFGRLGMLIIKGFDNFDEVNHYRRVMAAHDSFRLPPGVQPIAISQQNFDTLLNQGRTFDDYFRFLQEHNYIDAQADIIPTSEIETLQEREEATEAALEQEAASTDAVAPDAVVPEGVTPAEPVAAPTTPVATPATKPTTTATPTQPAKTNPIPDGSEGDDPLLE